MPTPDASRGLTAGPKIAHFDRIEWSIIPDPGTAAAALIAGEVDWFEQMGPEIQTLPGRNRSLLLEPIDTLPLPGQFRFNHRQPPFDNPAIRRAFLHCISQEDFMTAIVGPDPQKYDARCGFFTPGSPMANDAGLAPLLGERSLARARQALKEAGYKGEPVRLLGTTDINSTTAQAQVAADMLRRLDLNLDGDKAAAGWPDLPEVERLRAAWLDAPDLPAQQAMARQIQAAAMLGLPYIPTGAYHSITAHKRDLVDRVKGFAIFWGIRRS